MRLRSVIITLLLTVAFAYYVYSPVPETIKEPWKMMMLGAFFRTMINLVTLTEWLGFDNYIFSIGKSTDNLEAPTIIAPTSDNKDMPAVKVSDITFGGIPVRVYEPLARGEGQLRRGLIFFHGGGWVQGTGKVGPYHVLTLQLSQELNAVVVSVEYQLYPEVLFPVPYLDCLSAAKHFLSPDTLAKYAIDPKRVGVSGDSSGGNLAAAVAQEIAKDDTMKVKFSVQALVYPALQALDFNTPSYLQNQDMPLLYRTLMVRFWMYYLGVDISLMSQWIANNHSSLLHSNITPGMRARVDWTTLLSPKFKKNYKPVIVGKGASKAGKEVLGLLDVRASPLLAKQEVLAKCPLTYIITCEHDVLRDDGLMYARRLQDAGVTVTSDHYEDGFHGCFSLTDWPFDFDVGLRSQKAYFDWLRDNL